MNDIYKNSKKRLIEKVESILKEFNEVKNGDYLGTLNKSRDYIISLITRGKILVKDITGDNSDFYCSILDFFNQNENLRDRFYHIKGTIKALNKDLLNKFDLKLIKSTETKKNLIIKSLENFITETYSSRNGVETALWLKRIIFFIENELPSSKRYQNIKKIFSQFLEGLGRRPFTAKIIDENSQKLLQDLISYIKKEEFDIFYLNLHQKVCEVSLDLFKNGHYSEAIFEASKALNNFIKEKANITNKDLANAMAKAFDEKNPLIKLNELKTQSDKDEQEGFKFLFMGAMKGIRNPRGHETIELNDPKIALEYLAFISLLFRRAVEGKL